MQAFICLTLLPVVSIVPLSAYKDPASTTFYIRPESSSSNQCPHDHPCLTLDDFAIRELPNIGNASKVTLMFLHGDHNLTIKMNFTNIKSVELTGMNSSFELENPQTWIELSSCDIYVINATSELRISNVAFDGKGKHSIIVKNVVQQVTIFKTTVLASAVLIQSEDPELKTEVHISDVLFNASKINVNGTKASVIFINNSVFRSGNQQQQTVVLCFTINVKFGVSIVIDNNTFLASGDTLGPPERSVCDSQLTHGCSDLDLLVQPPELDVPTGINSIVQLAVTNSSFLQAHRARTCTAMLLEFLKQNLLGATVGVHNTVISGYMQGAIVLVNYNRLIDFELSRSTIENNSLSSSISSDMEVYYAGAGLTIYNLYSDQLSKCQIINCTFRNNHNYQDRSAIILLYRANFIVHIVNCTFINNQGTPISAYNSAFTLTGTDRFESNNATKGGGLALFNSKVKIDSNTYIYFYNNTASKFGGAIYVENEALTYDILFNSARPCFYEIPPLNIYFNVSEQRIFLRNNTAKQGGNSIYGTSVNRHCYVRKLDNLYDTSGDIVRFESDDSYSPVSSKATRVCICIDNQPQCANISTIFTNNCTVYPGESFTISAVTVGQEFGATTGMVYTKFLPSDSKFPTNLKNQNQAFQNISFDDSCIPLNYTVYTKNSREIMYLTAADITLINYGNIEGMRNVLREYKSNSTNIIPISLLTAPVFINITLRPCPLGFTMTSNPPYYCDCYSELKRNNVTCVIENGRALISCKRNNWIGRHSNKIVFNDHCPFDHCKPEEVLVDLQTDPDAQCAFNHAGRLCGGCKVNYSLAIGSSHCLYCPNSNNAALFLFFMLAGPLLYVTITVLDLTITKGTINGLLFYANIVWIYQYILFPRTDDITNKHCQAALQAFKIFIAWLNLDFGIEICFINGLDAFWKSILQYAFPIYIWVIAGVVIVLYRHINVQWRCLRRLGKPMDILVTFILLSYTKLVRTIVAAFGFAVLTNYPDSSTEVVWALDGNVNFLKGKHALLFVMALLALIATVFYTMYILLVGLKNYVIPCECKRARIQNHQGHRQREDQNVLQDLDEYWPLDYNREHEEKCTACSCRKVFDMPLPLHDAHFAPLDNKHRYWLGLMLSVRIILLVIFSTTFETPRHNLLVLLITASLLLFYMAWNNIYKDKLLQMLESLSMGNLIFFSGGIIYADLMSKHTWNFTIVSISIGIAFIQFLGIIVHRFTGKKTTVEQNPAHLQADVLPNVARHANLQGQQVMDPNGWREPLLEDDDDEVNEREPLIAHPPRKYFCCCN